MKKTSRPPLRQFVYNRLNFILPAHIRRLIKTLVPGSVYTHYNPLNDPDYMWSLHGYLRGYRFKIPLGWGAQYVAAPHEIRVCEAIQRQVKSSMQCADVGAHYGYMSLLIAKNCGQMGKVFAFEASPMNTKILAENIRINHLIDRFVIENLAVTDGTSDMIELYDLGSTSEFSVLSRPGHTNSTRVKATSLDKYFTDSQKLHFIKMDIEGGEAQAIRGMERILKNQRPTLLIELHNESGMQAVNQLLASNYLIFDLEQNALQSANNLDLVSHIIAIPSN